MPDIPMRGYQAFVKQELIEEAGGVVRSSAGRRAKALDLRRPGLFPRIRSKPWSRHSGVFLLTPFGDGYAISGSCKKVPFEAKP